MRITGNIISGVILLIVGFMLLLANFLGIKINLFRLFPGLAFLILGVIILFGQFGGRDETIFDRRKIDISEPFKEKNIIFAEGIVDLNDLDPLESTKKIILNVVFASSQLKLNQSIPTIIHANTVFGNLQLPGQSINIFGSTEYKSADIKPDEPYLEIGVDVVFGQLRIIKP